MRIKGLTDKIGGRELIKTAAGAAAGALVAAHLRGRAAEDRTQAPQGAEVKISPGYFNDLAILNR